MAKQVTLIRGSVYMIQHGGAWVKFRKEVPCIVEDDLAEYLTENAKDPITIPATPGKDPETIFYPKFKVEATAEAPAGRPPRKVKVSAVSAE